MYKESTFTSLQGFFQLMCSKSCCVYFHKICWKRFKNLKYPGEDDQVFIFAFLSKTQHFFLSPYLFLLSSSSFLLIHIFPFLFCLLCFLSLVSLMRVFLPFFIHFRCWLYSSYFCKSSATLHFLLISVHLLSYNSRK